MLHVRSSHEGPLYAPRPCATEDDARINAFEDQFLGVRSAPVACGRIFQWTFSLTIPLDSLSSALSGNFRTVHSPVPEMPANFPVPATNVSIPPQDEIVSRLANRLGHELAAAEARRAERAINPDSMDHYFLGQAHLKRG